MGEYSGENLFNIPFPQGEMEGGQWTYIWGVETDKTKKIVGLDDAFSQKWNKFKVTLSSTLPGSYSVIIKSLDQMTTNESLAFLIELFKQLDESIGPIKYIQDVEKEKWPFFKY